MSFDNKESFNEFHLRALALVENFDELIARELLQQCSVDLVARQMREIVHFWLIFSDTPKK